MVDVCTWTGCIVRKGKESEGTYSVVDVGTDDETFLSSILTVLYTNNVTRLSYTSIGREGGREKMVSKASKTWYPNGSKQLNKLTTISSEYEDMISALLKGTVASVLMGLRSSALLEAAMKGGRDELVVWVEERR